MSESMIERVARVLCEASGESWREPPYNHLHTDRLNNHWRYKVRKVFEAMREPTEATRMAPGDGPNTSTRVYQAMIDAALSEEVE